MLADAEPGRRHEQAVARAVFVVSLLATALLYALPQLRVIAYPLVLLSTLAHEMGHGLAALLVGGKFVSFDLFSDGSGIAHTAGVSSRVGTAFVSAGGLVGPSCAAAVTFLAGRRPTSARLFLTALCVATLIALVVVVRSSFGWFFMAGFALVLAWLVAKSGRRWPQIGLVFLGTQLGLSVYSRADYLFTQVAQTSAGPMPSDVAAMAEALLFPYWFWGALCGGFSILVLLFGARTLWKA
jgi:hypothetical protein